MGESVIGCDDADYRYYHIQRLRTDSLLQALKPHCRDYFLPAQIDTLRNLLTEKEIHLLHLMQAIEQQDEADSRMRHAQTIHDAAGRMAGMINSLLVYFRLDSGKETPSVKPFKLCFIAEKIHARSKRAGSHS